MADLFQQISERFFKGMKPSVKVIQAALPFLWDRSLTKCLAHPESGLKPGRRQNLWAVRMRQTGNSLLLSDFTHSC